MLHNVKILADSRNIVTGDRITTFELNFPRPLLAEINTHRMLSSNAGSSRAIPIKKVIEKIIKDPYIPQFTKNQKGMQGQLFDTEIQKDAESVWLESMNVAIDQAQKLIDLNIHKQNVNRLLEPWMYVPVLVTGTEWRNFFNLRCAEATHPDFRSIAREMKVLYDDNEPNKLELGQWHIPFTDNVIKNHNLFKFTDALKVATARAARISYTTHDGVYDYDRDFQLHDILLEEKHYSPFEHCAKAVFINRCDTPEYAVLNDETRVNTRNFRGWFSYRGHIEQNIEVEDCR